MNEGVTIEEGMEEMPNEVEMKPIEVEMEMKPRNGNETKLKPIEVEMKLRLGVHSLS
jgi:hypothetical protein